MDCMNVNRTKNEMHITLEYFNKKRQIKTNTNE